MSKENKAPDPERFRNNPHAKFITRMADALSVHAISTATSVQEHVERFTDENINGMILAALGLEKLWSDGWEFCRTNGYSGSLLQFVRGCAEEAAREAAPDAAKEVINGIPKILKDGFRKTIKSTYQHAYEDELRKLVKENIEAQHREVKEMVDALTGEMELRMKNVVSVAIENLVASQSKRTCER